ncbi:peptidoglycan-binding domain-containing protein [Echinimonas agarilytica]|uniref:Peptidoglycan-binding protein n=1 Tax=Echinimonas agarilytica TaxID=1215918 RepID=A0AA41W4H5_9GAMM|nr:peptidoglycan-binding domain-containing protein [Echinimonas agarilytica]MCM2678762.1 peptidoglycan-binding protein [Echinimonas agarilytica]
MKWSKLRLLSMLSAMVVSTNVQAVDSEGSFSVDGAGFQPCSQFVKAVEGQKNDLYVYIGWVDGYLSHYNRVTPNTFDITPWQTQYMTVKTLHLLCGKQPQAPFATAVESLVVQLEPHKLTEQSERVVISDGDAQIQIYVAVIEQIQAKLQHKSLVDTYKKGEFDDATRAGLKRFQQQSGLKVTGMPDQDTLLRLLLVPSR